MSPLPPRITRGPTSINYSRFEVHVLGTYNIRVEHLFSVLT